MNTLPPSQVQVYAQLWTLADEDKDGQVGQNDALSFFSKSGLTPEALGSIWSQVNPQLSPVLSPDQFVYCCQLISMAQVGSAPDLNQLGAIIAQGHEIPVPNFAGVGAQPQTVASTPGSSLLASGSGQVWGTTENLHLWMAHFAEQDTDRDGYVSGQEVMSFFLMSGLPQTTLGAIWSLADVNQDGRLDVQEFCAAMALIAGVNEGKQLPTSMPESLIQLVWPAGFPGQAPVASVISSQPGLTSSSPGIWAITEAERQTDIATFQQSAPTGYIEGQTAVALFSQSGVPVAELGQVYTLADLDGDGRLSQNEFFIAMKLIRARMSGTPIPATLPTELATRSGSGVLAPQVNAGGTVVNVLERRVAELEAKLRGLEEQNGSLQIQINSLKDERDRALLQKQEADGRAAQALAQVEALGNQNQQSSTQATARINELAQQVTASQAKMQEMQQYNAQLESKLQQQDQQLKTAQLQAEHLSYQAAQAQAQQTQPQANPFGVASANPFGVPSQPVNPFVGSLF